MGGPRYLEAVKLLLEHYRELWEAYERGEHVRQYLEILRRLSTYWRR